MGDDKDKTSRKLATTKSGAPNQKTAMTDDKTVNLQRRRRRRRRSLFSLLFTGGSQADVDQNDSSEDEKLDRVEKTISNSQDSLRKQSTTGKKRHQRARNQDVVLIKPREAKCAEATLVSLVNESHEADDEADESVVAKTKDTKVTKDSAIGYAGRATTKDNNSSDHQQQQQQKNTLQSLVKRKMRKFKVTKSKSHDEDADSYILDLNDCLDREKLRVSSSSSSTSSSNSSSLSHSLPAAPAQDQDHNLKVADRAKEFSPLREISPIDDKWQTNREYIPTVTTKQQQHEHNESNNNLKLPQKPTELDKKRRQQTSPLLVEFLESHRIKLRSGGNNNNKESSRQRRASGDSLDAKRTVSPPSIRSGSSSSSSSCDSDRRLHKSTSNSLGATRALPPVSYFDELQAEARMGSKLNELSESERRLYHWRKLAARSVTMWQVPDESSSDEESDDSDLGDFIDCHSPARVCYCSDDTSCSSVELIWSRPSGGGLAQMQAISNPTVRLQPAADFQRSHLTRPLHLITTPPTSAASSSELNVSPGSRPSLSPARSPNHHMLQVAARPSRSYSRSPTPQRLQVYTQQHNHLMRYNSNQLTGSSNNNSLKSVCSGQSMCQRPAILELAKPSRARDRRIGDNNNNNIRSSRRTKEEKMAVRRSMPAPLTPGQVDTATDRGTRDWSAVPVSRSASGSDWVPNPLFGRLARPLGGAAIDPNPTAGARAPTPKIQKQAKSCDDYSTSTDKGDELAVATHQVTGGSGGTSTRRTLRRHQSVDLQQQQQLKESIEESAKRDVGGPKSSSKFKNFLARIKRQDTTKAGDTTSESDKNNSSQELEDEFNAADDAGAAFTDCAKRHHRWSLRMRSPFAATGQSGANNGDNHAYLSHLVNARMDTKRIKSNVSSFKNQLGERLSDTGKRASVLADQLIASIKDTTKEQLLLATTGTPARDRYDTLPNSFASSPTPADPLLVQKQLLPTTTMTTTATKDNEEDGLGTQQRKAKLFSLIYMHQAQQQATAAGGRPVITRQPTSAIASRPLRSQAPPPPVIDDESKRVELGPSGGSDQPQVDLDRLLDPKELLLDRFRAMERELLAHRQATNGSELIGDYQRLSKTIAPRDKELATIALKANAAAAAGPKRRASCTV